MHGKPLITTACIAFRADERLAHQHGHAVCQPPRPADTPTQDDVSREPFRNRSSCLHT